MSSASPSGHVEAMGRKKSGSSDRASGAERVWSKVDGDDPMTWVHSWGSQGRWLSFYLNTLALAHYALFPIELHFLGSPAFTLSYSPYC